MDSKWYIYDARLKICIEKELHGNIEKQQASECQIKVTFSYFLFFLIAFVIRKIVTNK